VRPYDQEDAAFLKTLSILYVEDDAQNRETLGLFLKRRAGSVLLAENGLEGLAAFRDKPSHLVVTDIQMPDLDGLSMAQAIRAIDPQVPIIVTTAFEQTDYLLRSIEIGIDRYVLKPIQADHLESALLVCAHRLLAEQQLRLKEKLEAETIRNRHHAAMHLLFGGISHDYNNLLQSILGSIELAKSEIVENERAQRFLELAATSSAEIRHLSKRLLLLSESSIAASQVGSIEILLRRVVEEVIRGTACAATFKIPSNPAKVRFHPDNLALVFANLAENAKEAMPAGGVLEVTVELLEDREGGGLPRAPGSCLQIRFQDSGRGISPEHLPRIFDPYFSTKDRGRQRGMGLGLALCEAIVRTHGGTISADSKPECGTTLVVNLPVTENP